MAAAGHSDSDTEFGLFSRHGDYARQSSLEQERDLPSARQRLRDMLEDPSSSGAAQAVQYFIVGAIITGSLITVVETMPSMRTHAPFLYVMDFLVTIVYSIEIVLRLYTTDSCVGFCVFYNIVDVVSTLPGYLELVIRAYGESPKTAAAVAPIRILRIFRVVRLLRVVRVIKLIKDNRNVQQTALLFEVIMEAASSGFCVILLLFALTTVIASTLLYLFEAPQCLQGWVTPGDELYAIPPQDCTAQSNFDSIPAVFWWAVTTLTTVGYGDMVPTSPAGKVVAGLMCVCGVMIMIVASAQFSLLFRERWVQAKARDHFRRQLESHSDSARARELDEVEQLAASMRRAVDQLVARVAGASLEVGGESTPAEVAPLLMSIRAHASVLNLGTSAFIYDALASALLESEAKSAIPEEGPPDAEGFLERRTSMNDVGSAPTTAAIVRQLSPAGACPGSRLDRLRKYGRATTTALTEEEMHPLEEASGAIDAAERRRSEPGLVALRSPDRFGEDAAAVAEGAGAGAGPPPTGLAPELPDEDGEADGCAALPGAVLEPRAQARARPATAGEEDGIDADGEAEGCATAAAPALPAALPAAAPERSGAAAGEADGEDDGRAAGSATAPPAAVAARPAGAAGADGDDAADDALR